MKEMIEYIVKALVDHPDQVKVNELAGERTLTYEVRVAEGDQGKIIGKDGRTAKAIRAIVDSAAKKMGKHARFEILD
jgi:predicted RNA-binding protein YlqC (UPF0109 family)